MARTSPSQLPLLAPPELARQIGVPVKTLYNWRANGKGPRAIRVGKHLRYRAADVDAWLEQQADPISAA